MRRCSRWMTTIYGAITVRMKTAPKSVIELHVEANRRDARMRSFVDRAREADIKIVETDGERLDKMAGTSRHQGVVARVEHVIGVEKDDDVPLRRSKAAVVRGELALILLPDERDARNPRLRDLERAIRRSVIDENDLRIAIRLTDRGGDRFAQVPRIVVVADDDRELTDRAHCILRNAEARLGAASFVFAANTPTSALFTTTA